MVRAYKKNKGIETDSELELIMTEAARKMALGEQLDPKVIIPIWSTDAMEPTAMAIGGNDQIDYTQAIERMRRAKEEH